LLKKAEQVLRELVLTRSSHEDSPDAIVEVVTRRLRALGLEPRFCGDPRHPVIIAQHKTGGAFLSGHLDTVPIGEGWSFGQGHIEGGVMYGRGTADMKGGCAAMLLGAERMVVEGIPFALCFTTDEEVTMAGAASVANDSALKSAPAVLVTEPTGFDIIVREKGLVQFSLKTTGVSAHASMPHLGDNAIAKMVRLLATLEDLQEVPDDHLEKMTMCVDTIRGGKAINVIPDDCEVEVDVRYPPTMTMDEVLSLVRERTGDMQCELTVLHDLPPVETNPQSEAVRTLRGLLGQGAKVSSVPYATEIVMFRKGNPTVMVWGPGDPKMAHVIDEHIEISQIPRAAQVYTDFCRRMSGLTPKP
jgi:acetylornithine deacetylase/succinyl-diaminopimelate desuccinylase-like protein